jgi:hypothetical protein
MKNLFYITMITIASLLMVSCDSTTDPVTPTPDPKGNLFVTSIPIGAQIWRDGVNTNKVTPDTLKDLDPKVYSITLKLQDYNDTTFSVSVSANQTSVVTNVPLVSNIILQSFGPVRIWETTGTGVSQPSGLDLSSAMAYGISSIDKDKVDIYYFSNAAGTSYLVQSADLNSGMTRVTKFRAGATNILNDGVDSPLENSGVWTSSIADRDSSKYVFLFDADGHYSKIKIVNWGGGTTGSPAWVEIKWFYNNTAADPRF